MPLVAVRARNAQLPYYTVCPITRAAETKNDQRFGGSDW